MNNPHFQSGLMASTVFTEFPVTLLVNVILSPSVRSGHASRRISRSSFRALVHSSNQESVSLRQHDMARSADCWTHDQLIDVTDSACLASTQSSLCDLPSRMTARFRRSDLDH